MHFKDISKFLKKIKKQFAEFIFGIIIGFVIFTLISSVLISFMLFLGIANLILTAMIFLKISEPTKISKATPTKIPNQRNVCPECGSPARHKKECSRGKKK